MYRHMAVKNSVMDRSPKRRQKLNKMKRKANALREYAYWGYTIDYYVTVSNVNDHLETGVKNVSTLIESKYRLSLQNNLSINYC